MSEASQPGTPSRPLPVRPLQPADCADAARMHVEVLSMEFIARFGERFMCRYYQAWLESPGGLALGADDSDGRLVGVLLGATEPATHTSAMVRRHGAALAAALLVAAATRPALARDLVATRATRYARGLWTIVVRPRMVRPRHGGPESGPGTEPIPAPEAERLGEITHVLVSPDRQGQGVGKALIASAVLEARRKGLEKLVLVTPPDQEARLFYERLGWTPDGEVASRSGERYVRYSYRL